MNDTAHLLAAFLEERMSSSAVVEAPRAPDSRDSTRRFQDALNQLKAMMEGAAQREFEAKIYDIVKNRVNLHVYVTNAEGIVLYDSRGLRTGEDLSRMNDVYLTLRNRYGARSSRMVESDPQTGALYVAAPIRYQDRIMGVLTVIKPKDSVTPFIAIARQRSLTAALVTAFAIFMFSGLIMLWVTLPVRRLAQYVADLQKGKRVQLPSLGKTEIGDLGRALEGLKKELEGKDYVEKYIQTLNHEIKSPLTALRGSVELLEEDLPPERRATLVSNIKEETGRIQNMIDRMLDLSSVENQDRIESSPLDLHTVLQEQISSIVSSMAGNPFRIQWISRQPDDPQLDAPPFPAGISGNAHKKESDSRADSLNPEKGECLIQGDAFLLGRAISNLLRNALDFHDPGSPIVCVIWKGPASLTLEIINQGPPIPSYARSRLFHRFYSLPRPSSGRKSTGLGLPFVQEVMDLHGGEVSLWNWGGPTSTVGVAAYDSIDPGSVEPPGNREGVISSQERPEDAREEATEEMRKRTVDRFVLRASSAGLDSSRGGVVARLILPAAAPN